MAKTIAALFENRGDASRAVQDLVEQGFARDDISLMAHDETHRDGDTTTDDDSSGAAQGAGMGAALGGVGGLVVGLTALAIPGIGPVIAAGPLATALLGAGVGAAAGGVIGALTDMGIPEEHAHYYGEGMRRGGVLVTVATTDEMADRAVTILSHHHPVDLTRRAEEWRNSGWTRFDPQSEAYHAPAATGVAEARREAVRARTAEASVPARAGAACAAGASPSSPATPTASAPPDPTERSTTTAIPVVEEEIQVGKRAVEREVRVHTSVTEQPVEEQVHLREEHVTVERRPVDRPASAADQTAFKEGVIEMTETVEELVVTKQARVVEEVVVQKEATDRVETVRGTVRRTEVEVEQEHAPQASSLRSFATYEAGFRTHFTTTFAQQQGATYDAYLPAYRYGYTCATDPRYSHRDWAICEAEARREWEQRHPGTWERFKAAIQHAWDEVQGRR
jgi:stress response protein YsnF